MSPAPDRAADVGPEPEGTSSVPSPSRARVVCVGGAVLDRKFHLAAPAVPGTSNPATAATAHGGVARNVAETLGRLGVATALVSCTGDDAAGRELRGALASAGVDVTGVRAVPGEATAEYVAVLGPDGDLALGVAATAVLDRIGPADVDHAVDAAAGGWLLLDANLGAGVLARAVHRAHAAGLPVAFDAVSTPKVVRLPAHGPGCPPGVTVLFGNRDEARAWLDRHAPAAAAGPQGPAGDEALAAGWRIAAGVSAVLLTRGAAGVVVADAAGVRALPATPATVVDVTGAGDALVAGTLAALARVPGPAGDRVAGAALDRAVAAGTRLAALAVGSGHSVRPGLVPADLDGPPATTTPTGRVQPERPAHPEETPR